MSSRALQMVTVLLFALALAGCSDGELSGASEVRPFSEVQETEFVFEPDPTNPGRGIFRVTTTEPMICAIVWGEDEEFGNINNSLSMNGTGIIEHDVFLPGAEPGVEYVFKVQGSTADGTLYESPVGTFTIPVIAASGGSSDGSRGPNLAPAATVIAASSEFSGSFAASNAVDGDSSTEWATSGDGDDAFITIDLGSSRRIAGVEFVTRSMADGTAVTEEYTVTVGESTFGPFEAGSLAEPRFAAVEVTGQVLRFDLISTTGGNTGAVEIRVFGASG